MQRGGHPQLKDRPIQGKQIEGGNTNTHFGLCSVKTYYFSSKTKRNSATVAHDLLASGAKMYLHGIKHKYLITD